MPDEAVKRNLLVLIVEDELFIALDLEAVVTGGGSRRTWPRGKRFRGPRLVAAELARRGNPRLQPRRAGDCGGRAPFRVVGAVRSRLAL